ncbi:homeobox-leucine zipper protein HDG5 [Impatiens glandulifera]|uniref:homeobox-leucine zipper protein HDG5 n=1 Tax=Impatiens glandulifera TaxID=253017 RepID=UPI001FB084A9|nr:homeobox-leucine zipper protein HDG5 [Impatiens glandulifera]
MYGDCQVLTSSLGGGMSTDTLFPSQVVGQNPNFNFMANLPFHSYPHPPPLIPKEEVVLMRRGGKDEMESGSGSEQGGVSGNDQDGFDHHLQQHHQQQQLQINSKKKRYHRHTARQIQEMEALFKECPHPDDKQRLKLSQELGLKPRQVKFWFQNRRTQMKAQQDRSDNVVLRNENENLRNENYRLQAALRSIICPACGGPPGMMMGDICTSEDHNLRLENARLKEEFERVCCIASRYSGRPLPSMEPASDSLLHPSLDLDMNIFSRNFHDPISNCADMFPVVPIVHDNPHFVSSPPELMILEDEKPLAMEMAMSSMDELIKMCQFGEPLWMRSEGGSGSSTDRETLNMEEYGRMFPWLKQQQSGNNNQMIKMEATRCSSMVIMNSITLVDAFLDANKWLELFPSVVSRAKTLQIITSPVSGHASGSLHLMYAELQVLSPLVPTREMHFLRYCQHNPEEGSWAVVDFPIERGNFHFQSNSFPRWYKRRPSGCIIQDMPNGYSRVTWVEHGDVVEDDITVHQVFNEYVNSGMAFGASRWLAVLQRQCERFASLMARNISDLGVIPSTEARKNLMNLAQRMIRTFCTNISTSCGLSWTALSDSLEDTVRIATRKATDPGQPNGLILTAVSTTWLPYHHFQVFDLLRDKQRRAKLDVLSNGNSLHEVAHIANGSHPGNCISLLRVNVASNSSQNVELMLQESCTDDSGSLVVYSTVNVDAIQLVMSATVDEPSTSSSSSAPSLLASSIPLLPLGFVIIPNNNGCLLTVGLQVLASTIPNAKLSLSSVTAINTHITNVVHQINAALGGGGGGGSGSVMFEGETSGVGLRVQQEED